MLVSSSLAMIWPALTWSPSSISSSTILAVILEATVAWRRATTYPEASRMEPAAAPSPAMARAVTICTGTPLGRIHHQTAMPAAASTHKRCRQPDPSFAGWRRLAAAIDAQLIEKGGLVVH